MSGGRTTLLPSWELEALKKIVDGRYPAARVEAMADYVGERVRRRRHAAVRDPRDRERRTLVGAHVPRVQADLVAMVADREGMSVTAWVKLALRQAMERSDTYRDGKMPARLD